MRHRSANVLLVLIAGWVLGPEAAAAQPLQVPVVLSLSGSAAFLGQGEKTSLEIAGKVVNDHGGIRGRPLELMFHDDQSSPEVAVQLAARIRLEASPIVLGSGITAMCNAMAPVFAGGKVMYCISPGIHPTAGSSVFTAFISSHDMARALVNYFRGRGFTRLAMITSTDASGQDGRLGFEEAMQRPENKAMQIVASVRFSPSDVSVAAQVAQMSSARPQAVIAWTSGAPLGTVLKGIVQGGLDVPVGTTNSNMTFAQMDQYADFLPSEMLFMSSPWPPHGGDLQLPARVNEAQQVMFAAYAAAGKTPDMAAAAVWDTGMLTAAALRDLGPNATAGQIRAYLAGTKDWPGVNGIYDFTKIPQRGLDMNNAVVTRWQPDKKTWTIVSRLGGEPLTVSGISSHTTSQFMPVLIGGILQGCMYGLLAIGFSLIYRVAGTINLAQGMFGIAGALVATSIQQILHLSIIPSGVLAVVVVALLALLLGVLAFLPGLKRLPPGPMFILTAGLLTLLEGAALVLWGSRAYSLPAFSGERPLHVLGLLFPPQGLWLLGVTVLITAALAFLFARTRLGHAFRACAENPMAAGLMGIRVERLQLLGFVLAAAVGAVGGIVMGPLTSFEFDTGRMYTIFGFIAAVTGAIGSSLGALAGGILLGVATQLAAAYVSSLFSNALALLILLAVLLWRPNGLLSYGPARRQDVREEARVQRAVIRIGPRTGALLGAGAALIVLVWLPLRHHAGALMNPLTVVAIFSLAAVGLDVLMGFGGLVSLGQAGFMAIGGYTAGVLVVHHGFPPLTGVAAGVALSLLCALALAWTTMRLRGLYLAVATLAFSLLVDSLAAGLDSVTGGPSGLVGIPSFSLGGYLFDTPLRNYYLAAGLLVMTLIVLASLLKRGFGRALMAMRADPLAAAALGIRVRRYKIAAFCISAALGSLAGSLYAFYFHFLSPEMVGTPISLQMVAMVVIGGEGTLFGPLIGVALIILLPTLFESLDQYKTLGTGLLLAFVSLYLPNGLFGSLAALLSRSRHPRQPLPVTAGRVPSA